MVQRVGLHAPKAGGPGSLREPDPTCYIINHWGIANPTHQELFMPTRVAILKKLIPNVGKGHREIEMVICYQWGC